MPNMHPSRVTSGCIGPSVVTLVKQDYCREHFIQTCYEHLEECAEKFKERDQADELACDTRRRFLQEIVDQSTVMSLTDGDLSNLERIQLSQHGTALTCSLPINVGELVKMERMDTGERAEGIVRWRERRDGTSLNLGLEFYGCNNFWRLRW